MTTDKLTQELLELDHKARQTGRRNYKRLCEVQVQMLKELMFTASESGRQAQELSEINKSLLVSTERLAERKSELEIENNKLFWAAVVQRPDSREYHC